MKHLKIITTCVIIILYIEVNAQDYLSLVKEVEFQSRKFKADEFSEFLEIDPTQWSFESFINLYNLRHKTKLKPVINDLYYLDEPVLTLFGTNLPEQLKTNLSIAREAIRIERIYDSLEAEIRLRGACIREMEWKESGHEPTWGDKAKFAASDRYVNPETKKQMMKSFSINQLKEQLITLKTDSEILPSFLKKYPVAWNYISKDRSFNTQISYRDFAPVIEKPVEEKFGDWYKIEIGKIQAEFRQTFQGIPPSLYSECAQLNQNLVEHIQFIESWDEISSLGESDVPHKGFDDLNLASFTSLEQSESTRYLVRSIEALRAYVKETMKFTMFEYYINIHDKEIWLIRKGTKTTEQPIEMTIDAMKNLKEITVGHWRKDNCKMLDDFSFLRVKLSDVKHHDALSQLQAQIVQVTVCGEIDGLDLRIFNYVQGIKTLEIKCGAAYCKCKVKNLKEVQDTLKFQVVQL
jgi:hypothetical protein